MKKLALVIAIVTMCAASESLAAESMPDSLVLKGGEKGTTFGSLRIEGEDRVRVNFERPDIGLNLDARTAPGLHWEGILSALSRGGVNVMDPLWQASATRASWTRVYPWVEVFQNGSVARFRPSLENVAAWSLDVANPKGQTVAQFAGKGKPPKEITWDGRTADGSYAPPGYRYSYVLHAQDKAGNKRTFVGDGFELAPYRAESSNEVVLMFEATNLEAPDRSTPAILLETATWINRSSSEAPVDVIVTARSYEDGSQTARRITEGLQPLLLGNVLRTLVRVEVATDAPEHGTVAIHVAKAPAPSE